VHEGGVVSKPIVVYASERVLREAEELGFPGILETAVETAVASGCTFRRLGGGQRLVDVDGWVLRVATGDRTPQGRRKLHVREIERTPPGSTNRNRKGRR
jgi:hypothetical protein